ncbi:MAG TPA: expansin EXLX1 family cellulose-binding protein, partial [Streptosporangiaceae bacterium]|nr:expansin EXLX1 family cellulose-binding protein [Streptosporangiaceae bacterium]
MHATNRARWRAPWLVVGLAAIGVMALTLGVVHFAPTHCPEALLRAVMVPARAGSAPDTGAVAGEAVFYDPTAVGGRCSIAPLTSGGLYASLPRSRYRDGALCGAYLDIAGPLGTVRAQVVDMCPGCSDAQLDLSVAAFARIQQPSHGMAPVTWQVARDPALPGPLAVRVGPGSTTTQIALQVLNHGNPLVAVTIDGKPATLRADGYWIGLGDGPGPFQVQVTDTAAHTAALTGILLSVNTVQQTSVPMYG